MADQPEVPKPPTDTAAADALLQENLLIAAGGPESILTPEQAAGSARVIGQIAKGAAKQIVEHPLETAGEVAAGAGTVVAGAYFGVTAAGAAAIAAVPAGGYGLYRGIDIARTEGVGAIPDHLKRFYDEIIQTVNSKVSAMQTVYTGNDKDPKLQTAKEEVQGVGAATVPLAAGLIGGNPANGELGAQGIRIAADMAKTTAAEIARATLPMESVPALATGTMQTTKEVSSIAAGSPTIPSESAQETAVLSQNTGGSDSGSKRETNENLISEDQPRLQLDPIKDRQFIENIEQIVNLGFLMQDGTGHSIGTGFLLPGSKGLIATANHVLRESTYPGMYLRLKPNDEWNYYADFVARDSKTDLAILKVTKYGSQGNAISDMPGISLKLTLPKVGDSVYLFGYQDGQLKAFKNTVEAIGNSRRLFGQISEMPNTRVIKTAGAVEQGVSGGPCFTAAGDLVGINSFGAGLFLSHTGVIPNTSLVRLLQKSGLKPIE